MDEMEKLKRQISRFQNVGRRNVKVNSPDGGAVYSKSGLVRAPKEKKMPASKMPRVFPRPSASGSAKPPTLPEGTGGSTTDKAWSRGGGGGRGGGGMKGPVRPNKVDPKSMILSESKADFNKRQKKYGVETV